MLPMMHEMQHFNQIAKRIANIRLPKKYVIKRNREVLRFPVSFSCFEVLYQLFLFMQNKIVFGIW